MVVSYLQSIIHYHSVSDESCSKFDILPRPVPKKAKGPIQVDSISTPSFDSMVIVNLSIAISKSEIECRVEP